MGKVILRLGQMVISTRIIEEINRVVIIIQALDTEVWAEDEDKLILNKF
jgi:hypothetical protein